MFKRTKTIQQTDLDSITFIFDNKSITARSGDTVAAALLANGITSCRTTPVSNTPRSPYCMMGVCFECFVNIDGTPNVQACQVLAKEGMVVNKQFGARGIEHE